MGKLMLLPFAGLLIAAAPATTPPPALSNQIATSENGQAAGVSGGKPTQANVGAKQVCKLLPTSGTRLIKRTCLTADQWKQVEEEYGN